MRPRDRTNDVLSGRESTNTILAPRTRDSPGNWHLSPKIVDEHSSTQRAHGGRRNRYTAFVDYPTRYASLS